MNAWLSQLLIKLQEEDLAKLSIEEIAKLADKSKSTIYDYFESKEDILLAACQTRIHALMNVIKSREGLSGSPVQIYEYLMERFTEEISGISISFLFQIKSYYPKAWKAINELTENFVALLKELYSLGIKEGYYQPLSVELLAHLDRYFVTEIVTNPGIFSDDSYTLTDLVSDYLKLRLTGLMIRKVG